MRRPLALFLVAGAFLAGCVQPSGGLPAARVAVSSPTAGATLVAERPRLSEARVQSAVVRVEVPMSISRRETSRGVEITEEYSSGAGVVLEDGRVLTAYHVFRKAGLTPEHIAGVRVRAWNRESEPVALLQGVDGGRALARVQLMPEVDLAVITPLNAVPGVRGLPLSGNAPAPGDMLRTFMTSSQRAQPVDLRSPVVSKAVGSPHMSISGEALPGDSGGAVLNERGEVVGILIGGGPPFAPFAAKIEWADDPPFRFSTPASQRWERVDGMTFLAVDVRAALR